MMHRQIFLAYACLLLSPGISAQQNALPPSPHILVYGSASAQAIPDQFRIKLIISVTEMDANAARLRAEESLRNVLSGLRAAGVEDRDIVATRLVISPENQYDSDTRQRVFVGTKVERVVSAAFNDMESLSGFLQRTEFNQQLQLEGVETALRDEAEMMAALRTQAIADCRQKATSLAKEYGVELQGVYSVSDVAPDFDYGVAYGHWPSRLFWDGSEIVAYPSLSLGKTPGSDLTQTSFSTGQITLTDKIYTVFLIGDKIQSEQ